MCGIVGFTGRGDRNDLAAMCAAVSHRGPDGLGTFVDDDERIYLGHRRLAILDLEGGHQPMWNETFNVGVVFNGEIYNHDELREWLIRKGHVFRSHHSDTEVLVHGYEEWGTGLPERLNGMFAFAIYDKRRREVFCARDRFGEKPFYYAHKPGFLAFGSEINAVTRHPSVDTALDLVALRKYFAYGYIPAPHALCQGCRKLPGGHSLTYDLARGTIEIKCYWRFRLTPDAGLQDSDEPTLIEELRHLLSQAVRRRLISDRPLGIFLSGGVDSGTVLAMAAQYLDQSAIRTFTVGFTEPTFDESGHARTVARAFGTDHHERMLDLHGASMLVPEVLARLGEPLGDPSILPTYLLSAFTREHVTVALSGDGGDELFAGYDPFAALGPASLYSKIVPAGLHRGVRRLADLLPLSDRSMSLDFKLRRTLMGLSYPASIWNPVWMSPVEPRDMAALFEEPVRAEELYSEAITLWDESADSSLIDRSLEFFTNFYLQDDILTKVDRASMMVSLETRAVFLDNDLVTFCQRLPHRFKMRGGIRKYLLKKAVSRDLPAEVTSRPKKGFGVPIAEWIRNMRPSPATPVAGMRSETVDTWCEQHRERSRDHRIFLWSWLSLQHVMAGDTLGRRSPSLQEH